MIQYSEIGVLVPVLNQDGSKPDLSSDSALYQWRDSLTYSPETWSSKEVDLDHWHDRSSHGWISISAEMFVLGLSSKDPMPMQIAKGNLKFSINDSKNMQNTFAILTQDFLYLRWNSLFYNFALVIEHVNKEPVHYLSSNAYGETYWITSARRYKWPKFLNDTLFRSKKRLRIENTHMNFEASFINDPHSNRNTVSLWHSWQQFWGED